jgi:Disulfide bond formation protein DsbB
MRQENTVLNIKMLNVLDLVGMAIILILASLAQFVLKELPCPLCLLQRLGLLAMGFGFLLNIRYHIHPSHYALSLLAAVLTAFISLRQILLHIVPGSGAYGDPVLGLHLYTWVFIFAFATIIYIAIVMSFSGQYVWRRVQDEKRDELQRPWARHLCHVAFTIFFLMAVVNVISLFAECGYHECPDNPIHYRM